MRLIFILGGASSGKSQFAQSLAQKMGGKVLFIATAQPKDEEMRKKVKLHKKARPVGWHTLEEPLKLVEAIEKSKGYDVVLIDCLTLWLSNLIDEGMGEEAILEEAKRLLDACKDKGTTFILVSNEVGMGLVPPYPSGRHFRELLGRVNQLIAAQAQQVYLMVAGLGIELKVVTKVLIDCWDKDF